MSQTELHSYRLSSLEDPTDEMLQTLMEQVGESARRSIASADAEIQRRFDAIRSHS